MVRVCLLKGYFEKGRELELDHFCRTRKIKIFELELELANVTCTRTRLKIDRVCSPDLKCNKHAVSVVDFM